MTTIASSHQLVIQRVGLCFGLEVIDPPVGRVGYCWEQYGDICIHDNDYRYMSHLLFYRLHLGSLVAIISPLYFFAAVYFTTLWQSKTASRHDGAHERHYVEEVGTG